MANERILALARDLTRVAPRSARAPLGPYGVIAARALDKCRAELADRAGSYHYNCSLDRSFFDFTGIDAAEFKQFVATGASDEEVDQWIRENTTQKDPKAIMKWNNEMIGLRLCDLSESTQEYFETYIPQFCKPESKVKFFFDVYDVEEGVL